MLRRVFDLAEAAHLIRHRVEGHRLEATPAHGKYERIVGLKDPPVPTMLLELELDVPHLLLLRFKRPNDDGHARIVVSQELRRDTVNLDPNIRPHSTALVSFTFGVFHPAKLVLVELLLRVRSIAQAFDVLVRLRNVFGLGNLSVRICVTVSVF